MSQMLTESQMLNEGWAETKETLLDGLEGNLRGAMSKLFENQRKQMIMETAPDGAIAAHDIAGFRKRMLPMLRRVIPGTIGSQIVGLAPIDAPVAQIFTLRYEYTQDVAGLAAGATGNPWDANPVTNFGSITNGSEAFGNDPVLRSFYSGAAGAVLGTADPQDAGAGGVTNAAADEADISGSAARGAWPSSIDAANTGAFGPYGPDALGQTYAGSLYGGSGSYIEGSGGRTMRLRILSQAVEAKTRRLQAVWTPEAFMDMKNQHDMNLENEITQGLSAQVVQEIDSEILSDLIALAGTAASVDFATMGMGTSYSPNSMLDRFSNIGVYINALANEIARKTRRGAGNYIVVSPAMVSVLQSAARSVFSPAVEGSFKGPNDSMLVGTLNGTIKVYSYLWNQVSGLGVTPGTDIILVGRVGQTPQDNGYFYCPYQPITTAGPVINPVTYTSGVSLSTRYAKAAFTQTETSLGNSADYFSKLNVTNLQFV